MYFEVLSEIHFRKHPSQSSLYLNGAEYFYRQSWSSNYLFLRVCVLYVLYDSWVSTDLSVSIKTTTTTMKSPCFKVKSISYEMKINEKNINTIFQENVFENDVCQVMCMFVLSTMCEMGLLLWIS